MVSGSINWEINHLTCFFSPLSGGISKPTVWFTKSSEEYCYKSYVFLGWGVGCDFIRRAKPKYQMEVRSLTTVHENASHDAFDSDAIKVYGFSWNGIGAKKIKYLITSGNKEYNALPNYLPLLPNLI